MLAMEAVLCELSDHEKRSEQGLPPGFRFHPTDEELITFYLASKVFNGSFTHVKFTEVDLNRCEPWELPEVAKMGEREWYLYSLRDRKYPTGLRTNRATGAGYWKATGKDKEVYSGSSGALLGMKKTLVFYKGRAPRGEKTKWVMHEYRLDGHFSPFNSHPNTCKEEWVICRIFHKFGEKRTQLLQVQGHLDAPSSKGSLPPFHATPTSFTLEQLEYQFQNDLFNYSHLFPLHSFQPSSFPLSAATSVPGQISQQNCTLKVKEHNIPKQTKAEETFYSYQLLDDDDDDDANMCLMDNKLNNTNNDPSNFQNSLPIDLDAGLMMGFSSGAANVELRDSTTSTAFNKQGLQQHMLDDAPMGIDSWPRPQHV